MATAIKAKKIMPSATKKGNLSKAKTKIITLEYQKESPIAKKTLDYILSLGVFEIHSGKR
ncbi:MAG: hypothetical protein LBK18_01935 [Prevotellaceae bacterium]|jgi:hypothetical protein|nr:hypothetical protein [Prevotellaceae bacterium]